jgi:copper resistance protein D
VAAQLLNLFGFLSVLLRGGTLALDTLVMGGTIFVLWTLRGFDRARAADCVWESVRRLLFWSAAAMAAVELCWLAANSAILQTTTGLTFREVSGANFFIAGAAGACGAAVIAGATARKQWRPSPGLLLPAAIALGGQVMTSHAAGRLEHGLVLLPLTTLHQAATAAWIGGLPYLLMVLVRAKDVKAADALCRRFSRTAMASVAALAASGAAMSLVYVGSPAAVYGTSYGAMVVSKVALLGLLLLLGGLNFQLVRRKAMAAMSRLSLRRFAEAEIGIGFTVILAAASLTSQPPAVDLAQGRVNAAEIAQRMRPRWPRLETPPLAALSPPTPLAFEQPGAPSGLTSYVPGAPTYQPSGPGDIAWSEYNHHWAGLIVLAAGLLAVLARSGAARWARHWPLAFLGLAVFLFLRSDPENWPLGPRSFWQSFAVAEVCQHRIFVLLIVVFAVFEWGVRNGRIASRAAGFVFPLVCATGGALLLTHTHSLSNVKEELLAELSHIPLAILAVTAGWSRWLELRLPTTLQRAPSWIWPACFVLIGAVLLNYHES